MNKVSIGVLSVVCSLIGVGVLCAVDKPAQEAVVTESAQSYPVSFDTAAYHVTVNFPIPSKKIEQRNPNNRMYVAQGQSAVNPNGPIVTEAYSLLYQDSDSISGQKVTSAADLAKEFEKILSENKGVTVKEVSVKHQAAASSGYDQDYMVLEVKDHDRTDYYLMRFIVTDSGILVAVHTVQKVSEDTDLTQALAWVFIDSVALEKVAAKAKP